MATTFLNLQDITINILHGQTADQEQRCALAQDIAAGDLQFTVDDATQVSRGLIEVESELMWVTKVDPNSNTVYVAAFGRGYNSTTAASHTSGTMVLNNPRYPRAHVKGALTDCLNQIYPELYQVKKDESNTSAATQLTYPLPADCDQILAIDWQAIGPTKRWVPVRRWQIDTLADTTVFPNGKSVTIFDSMTPGRTIKILYSAAPGTLVNDTDTLQSTGLSDGVRDVLVYGAAARLVQSAEIGRLQTSSITQSDRDQLVTPGAATAASRAYWQLHEMRLQDERDRLQRLYPARTHISR